MDKLENGYSTHERGAACMRRSWTCGGVDIDVIEPLRKVPGKQVLAGGLYFHTIFVVSSVVRV